MMNEEERFEADLRAAMTLEPASADLRRRVLAEAMPHNRIAKSALPGWLAALDPRSWHLLELGALAAAASLAIGIFAGANGIVPGTTTTTVAANDTDSTIDLVALAYDGSGVSGDLQ